jgi:hypothetical protein
MTLTAVCLCDATACKCRAEQARKRLSRFRSLGSIMGLCLLHDNVNLKLPLFFCRHVYKFLLSRTVTFTDFAYLLSPAMMPGPS